jgi:hypothetical protein
MLCYSLEKNASICFYNFLLSGVGKINVREYRKGNQNYLRLVCSVVFLFIFVLCALCCVFVYLRLVCSVLCFCLSSSCVPCVVFSNDLPQELNRLVAKCIRCNLQFVNTLRDPISYVDTDLYPHFHVILKLLLTLPVGFCAC